MEGGRGEKEERGGRGRRRERETERSGDAMGEVLGQQRVQQ